MKGEIKKLKYNPLTLDSEVVKDGLESVAVLTGKEPYYVVGGVATQSYLPTLCRRATSDIDLSVVRPLNYRDFKEISKPIAEYLQDNGYEVNTRKKSRSFCLCVNKGEDNLLIELSRRNKKSFDNSKNRLERELENSKRKVLEKRDSTYSVASPEDIIVPKLVRCVSSLERSPNLKNDLPKSKVLSEGFIKRRLDYINSLREGSIENRCDQRRFELLRFVSDIYDIRVLSELSGVNINYFNQVSSDWFKTLKESENKEMLMNFISLS